MLKSIGFTWENTSRRFPYMTEDMYNEWRAAPIDEDYIRKCIEFAMAKSREKIIGNHFTTGSNITMKERHDKNLNECKNLIHEFGKAILQ